MSGMFYMRIQTKYPQGLNRDLLIWSDMKSVTDVIPVQCRSPPPPPPKKKKFIKFPRLVIIHTLGWREAIWGWNALPETQDNEPARSQTFTSPFEETNHYVSHLKSNTLTTKPAHLLPLYTLSTYSVTRRTWTSSSTWNTLWGKREIN